MTEPDRPTINISEAGTTEISPSVLSLNDTTKTVGPRFGHHSPLPEGGWGWMVVLSIFLLMTVLFGYVFSLAVYFVEWMPYFDASATEISWVISLGPAISGLTSPFAGALCTKFGSRRVSIVGSAIAFSGALLSAFAQSVLHLYFTLGVGIGIGGALIFSPSLVMLGHYFQKRYVLANSIAFCGYSFGQICVPRLTQLLIEEYGWRGALLIQAAIMAHMFVCAALLRPRIAPRTPLKTKQCHHHVDAGAVEAAVEVTPTTKEIWTSTTSLHLFDNISWVPSTSTTVLYHEDRYIKDKAKSEDTRWYLIVTMKSCSVGFVSFLKDTYGISSLGKSGLYIVTLLCSFVGGIGWFVTSVHLVARAVHAGISQNNGAFLITVIGLGGLVGRASHGIVIDRGYISRQVLFTASFAVTGIMSLANPFMDTFALLCVFAVVFGFSHGIANSLVFALMKLQVPSKDAAAALSFGTLVLATANTAGGVIAGVLYDITGSYDIPFYFAGGVIVCGTSLMSAAFTINHFKKGGKPDPKRRMSVMRLFL